MLVENAIMSLALALNPAVTQATIDKTICVPNWTQTVRPPVSYTNNVKRRKLIASGTPLSKIGDYELDHLVPLALGGAPSNPNNLWLQPWTEARKKDALEVLLQHLVCSRKMPLSDAQKCIHDDWQACARGTK